MASPSTNSTTATILTRAPQTSEAIEYVGAMSSPYEAAGEFPRAWQKTDVDLKESPPQVAREIERPGARTDSEAIRDAMQALARKARDSFRNACETSDEDSAEASYMTMRSSLEELWDFARYRDLAFRDLLAILDAATKHVDINRFNNNQRDALRNAFQDLPIWHIGIEDVDRTIERFAEFDIDITGPIRQQASKKYRVVIEEID